MAKVRMTINRNKPKSTTVNKAGQGATASINKPEGTGGGGGEDPPPDPPSLTEAIIVMHLGQSNKVTRAAADPANEVTVPTFCYEYRQNTNTLITLADPIGEPGDLSVATQRSAGPQLAKRLKELTGKPIIIIAAAIGNTDINFWLNKAGTGYTKALLRWNACRSYCAANGITILDSYIDWLQGENDGAFGVATDTYLSDNNTLIDYLFEDFTGLKKVFASRIGYLGNTSIDAQAVPIMLAQKRLNFSKDGFILCTNIPATFTAGNGRAKSGDEIHHSLLGVNEVATAVAEAIHDYRQNNRKTTAILTEPVTALQDAVGHFDDIYLFRSLTPGVNNSNYNEMFNRNNLSLASGSPTWQGTEGLRINNESTRFNPATVRTLTNAHDWTIELTLKLIETTTGMVSNGRSTGAWTEDHLYISALDTIQLRGNGVSTGGMILAGASFLQVSNIAIVYTSADNTLKVYYNGSLKVTKTDWTFSEIRLDTFFRGQGVSPTLPFNGIVERIRVIKRALAVYEFDNSPNQGARVIDWTFNFNSSLAELDNQVSSTLRNFAGTVISPVYDADGLVFDQNTYLRLGQQLELEDFTIEYRVKHDAAETTSYGFITGPSYSMTAVGGGLANRISHIPSTNRIYFNGNGGGNVFWTVTNDWNIFHTYKIIRNFTTGIAELFIDGVSQGTKTVVGALQVGTIGGGHPTQSYMLYGTMDWLKIKNFI